LVGKPEGNIIRETWTSMRGYIKCISKKYDVTVKGKAIPVTGRGDP
jgi:hypothetical protein